MADALSTPGVWSAQDTTPAAIEAALLELMHEQANAGMLQAPARVLNFVVVVEREHKGEVTGRLDRIDRDNSARSIVVVVEDDKQELDATATLVHDTPGELGLGTIFHERIEVVCGSGHLRHLDAIVSPLLASEVGTVVWSPHGHPEAIDSLRSIASTVLIDSLESSDWRSAIARILEISQNAEVCDLAWLRSTPWRERLAATFDPVVWRPQLDLINRVDLRMHPGSTMAALLYLGWLASRLEWHPHVLDLDVGDTKSGYATGPAGQIDISIENDETMPVPGLAGLTIETADGLVLTLNRGAGGLSAERTHPGGDSHAWTVIGASRGEDGILADGVTHAMFPDELFRPALDAACAFGGRATIADAASGAGS